MGNLDGKVAFVTGAARGMGRSHAVRLARDGADVIAIDICEQIPSVPYEMSSEADLAETARLVKEQGRRVFTKQADVRDLAQLESAVGEGVAELGRLDIVVANAGIATFGTSQELDRQTWQDVIDTNLTGVWQTTRAAVPHLLEHGEGGSIVLISSEVALNPAPGAVHYISAKTGVVGVMRVLGLELGPQNIRVNTIHPTQVPTDMIMNDLMWGLFCPDLDKPTAEDFAAVSERLHTLPIAFAEPEDVSNAIAFLVSDQARCITGVMLPVDCGASLAPQG